MSEGAFREAARLLDEAELVWWLSDGTALGCVRDGKLLGDDIDVGVWVEDTDRARDTLATVWTVTRDFPGQVQLDAGIKIDIHGHTLDGDEVWFPLGHDSLDYTPFRYVFPAHLFREFENHKFYGCGVRVPSPATEYLEAHYGPDWRTPRTEWHYGKNPPCVRLP